MAFEFDAAERRLLDAADDTLPALAVARRTTEVLASMIEGVTVPLEPENAPPSFFVRTATLLLSVVALRTARACMLVVATGYMPESHGLKRRLSEVHARAQAVGSDSSGQHARDWLDGRGPSTAHKIVGKFGSADLWDVYSWSAHADSRGVHQWLTVPTPDLGEGFKGLMVPPRHDDHLSNALLTEVGTECRDMAAAMAVARATTRAAVQAGVADVHALDADLDDLVRRYYTPDIGGNPEG